MNKNLILLFILSLQFSIGGLKAEELTVNNGTTQNQYVPIYGNWANRYSKSQFIIPATSLTGLVYNTINSMTFYSPQSNISWGNAKFEVYVTEVDYTTFTNAALVDWASMDKVMNAATLSIVNNQMVVVFDTPYQYLGGNLLIGIRQTAQGSYNLSKWYGVYAQNASIGGYELYRGFNKYDFLPKVTFNYTQGEPPSCIKPISLSATGVTAHTAILNWVSDADAWQICINNDEQNLIDVTDKPYTLEGLSPETSYTITLRTNCGNDGYSDWTNPIHFTTDIACHMPTNLSVALSVDHPSEATLSWIENGEASLWQICLNDDEQNLIEVTENPYTLTGLLLETTYTAKVRANCGGNDGTSLWSNTETFIPTIKTVIGSGTSTYTNLPLNSFYNFSFSQQIYTVAELGSSGLIESIEFYNASNESTRNLNLYIVSTDKDSFDATNDWVTVTEDDLMFSGIVNFAPNAWTSIPFNTYYLYDGLHNIVVAVDDNTGSYGTSPMSFRVFTASSQAMYYRHDSYNFNPTEPFTGTISDSKNQIRLVKSNASCMKPLGFTAGATTLNSATFHWISDADVWQICLDGNEENPIEITENPYTMEGLTPDTEYTAHIRTVCGDDTYSDWATCTFTTSSLCEVPSHLDTLALMWNRASLGWEGLQDSYNLRYSIAEPVINITDFENGMIPTTWNNNGTYPWTVVYDASMNTHYFKSSNQGVPSSESVFSFTATYTSDGTIEFDGNCMGEGLYTYYDHCDFYIDDTRLLYVGANTTTWSHYCFEVTAGSHTFTWSYTKDYMIDPTGDYFAIDNIVMSYNNFIWAPTIEDIMATSYTLTGLSSNTTYYVQVQGIQSACDGGGTEWSEMIQFTTPTPPTLTQTITLMAGWNYCSCYVDITLDYLKAALVEALPNTAITIKSRSQNTSYNPNNHRWSGVVTWDISQMYLIKVRDNCEIVLQGPPVDPVSHPISILGNGQISYIGFPFDENMTLTEAFRGFAVNGDEIKSKTGNSIYYRNRWMGTTFTILEPGQGYIYKSNVPADKLFTYPTR